MVDAFGAAAGATSTAKMDVSTDNGNIYGNVWSINALSTDNKPKRPSSKKAMAPGWQEQQEHTRIQISEP